MRSVWACTKCRKKYFFSMQRLILFRKLPNSFHKALCKWPNSNTINISRARKQHDAYINLVTKPTLYPFNYTKTSWIVLPENELYPDCCFVEDCAVSLMPNVLLLTNPVESSRNGEKTTHNIFWRNFASTSPQIKIEEMEDDEHCDGGDLLRIGCNLFVGVGGRTTTRGFERLKDICDDYSLKIVPVHVGKSALHLKSLVTWLGTDIGFVAANNEDGKNALGTILQKTTFRQRFNFMDCAIAANMLRIENTVIHHPKANIENLQKENPKIDFLSCDMSELNKADGALTCCSVFFEYTNAKRRFFAKQLKPQHSRLFTAKNPQGNFPLQIYAANCVF